MGFFADIASEARRTVNKQVSPPASPAAGMDYPIPDPAVADPAHVPATVAEVPEVVQSAPAPATPAVPSPASELEAKPESAPAPPTVDLTAEADAADEAQRKKEHEAAEAQRKAEFDAKQAAKKAAAQAELDRIAAMSEADALVAATGRIGTAVERITRRNMKLEVAAHLQAICRADPAFARLVMRPEKTLAHCFQRINAKALEYLKAEMEASGEKPDPRCMGGDVPDEQVFAWAVEYYRDLDAKEDRADREEFSPKPYAPSTRKTTKTSKKSAESKKPAPRKDEGSGALDQMSLLEEEAT